LGTWQAVLFDFWAILMLNCTDSRLRNPSTLGLLLLTPIKKVIIMKSFVKLPFRNFVNWMVGEQLGGGGGTPKKKKKV
jgi:hypothetical protein